MTDEEKNRIFENFESAIPGIVDSVNSDGTVNVIPTIRKISTNGVVDLENNVIPSVPVMDLGGGGIEVNVEISAGDQLILFAISRDSSAWKNSDGSKTRTPNSCGGNTLMDFVAVPLHFHGKGGSKVKISFSKDGSAEITNSGGGSISMASNGTVEINGHLEVTT
jgi:hypothetical protein